MAFSRVAKEGAVPFALTTPRRVAIPLMESVRAELQKMEMLGVISRIETPTDWCAGMVVVPKPNKRVRICVDLTKLNENVRRERHPLPAVEQTLAQIAGARVFSKLDANSGFWQIPLSAKSTSHQGISKSRERAKQSVVARTVETAGGNCPKMSSLH